VDEAQGRGKRRRRGRAQLDASGAGHRRVAAPDDGAGDADAPGLEPLLEASARDPTLERTKPVTNRFRHVILA